MTQAVAEILKETEQLSSQERAELADRLVEKLFADATPDFTAEQMEVVRRRVDEVENGTVTLIPLEQGLAAVRQKIALADAGD